MIPPIPERSAAPSERGGTAALPDLPDLGERYRIERELGRGGMGRVFVARDLRLGRQVAIKLLSSGAHREDELRRFAKEARAAGSLNHPNILAVHDVGACAAGPYIVSELLDGSTLRERLDGKPLPLKTALRYTVELAKGLAAAHDHGVVHCDVKPENLFVTNEGRLTILPTCPRRSRWKSIGLFAAAWRRARSAVTSPPRIWRLIWNRRRCIPCDRPGRTRCGAGARRSSWSRSLPRLVSPAWSLAHGF